MAIQRNLNICFLFVLFLCFYSFLEAKEELIPQNCVLEIEAWHVDDPVHKTKVNYHINNGQVTATYDTTFEGKIRHTGTFQGKLQGNVMSGTWQHTMHKWTMNYGRACICTRWGSWKEEIKSTLNPDGTLSTLSHRVGTIYDEYQGQDCTEQGLKTFPQDIRDSGYRGTWRIGKEEVSGMASSGASEKERALAGYKRLLQEKKECEKYLNSPEAKIDYLGTHPESPTIMKRVKQLKDNQFLSVSEDTPKATPTESYRNRLSELNVLIPKVKKLIDSGKYKEALEAMSP